MRIVDVLERDAELYPSRTALVVADGRSVTFTELTDRVHRIAAGLESLGIGRGSRVALMADDGAVFFDIDAVKDPASPLPHMLPPPEVFSSKVRKLGLGDGNRIVVYDQRGLFSGTQKQS